jgi:predicted CXXCH cytochrome family protein
MSIPARGLGKPTLLRARVGIATATTLACATLFTRALVTAEVPGASAIQAEVAPTRPARVESRPWWLEAGDRLEYVGSAACRSCHEEAYAAWKSALHLQMTKPVAEARILGDFRPGTRLAQNGRRYAFEQKDGRYFVSVSHGGRRAETFEVHYTLGAYRYQGYLSRLADGRIYVLPVFWHTGSGRWLDWREITPVPDGDHDLRQIWNVTCFNCHATNLSKGFDVAARVYRTEWTEMGIGCEACHGPGAAHEALTRGWERNPGSKPAYDNRKTNHELSGVLRIFAARAADRRQVFDTCAYCHGNKTNAFTGFVPGARFDDFALPFLVSESLPEHDPQGDFWPDGRPSRFNRPQALMLSGCFTKSEITCTSCHVAHGSKNAFALKVPLARSDLLCLQCHQTVESRASGAPRTIALGGPDVTQHTRHQPGSEGSRCVNCHMSSVNWRLLMRRRDHTFKPPVPEMTARLGVPNACNECHDDRTPEWAVAKMDEWYGDGERRARELQVAETITAAANGDASSMPGLASLLVDRRHGAPLRAAAADFVARFLLRRGTPASPGLHAGESQTSFEGPGGAPARRRPATGDLTVGSEGVPAAGSGPVDAAPALVNALIGAAADPEAMVRTSAVRALAAAGRASVVPALTARLVDPSRVVRISAARALLDLGLVSLPGRAGVALSRAQGEYALGLTTFDDAASDHLALGWFEMQRHREPEARAALGRALALEPASPQPRVFLGVLDARNGRYDDAIAHWRRVRSEHPGYPNIDRLIAEAERRKKGPR